MKFNSLISGARDPETSMNPKVNTPHNIIAKVNSQMTAEYIYFAIAEQINKLS